MDIREFAQEFQENIKMAVDMGNTDYDQELASAILKYIEPYPHVWESSQ